MQCWNVDRNCSSQHCQMMQSLAFTSKLRNWSWQSTICAPTISTRLTLQLGTRCVLVLLSYQLCSLYTYSDELVTLLTGMGSIRQQIPPYAWPSLVAGADAVTASHMRGLLSTQVQLGMKTVNIISDRLSFSFIWQTILLIFSLGLKF